MTGFPSFLSCFAFPTTAKVAEGSIRWARFERFKDINSFTFLPFPGIISL
jgi:hypothetical protein